MNYNENISSKAKSEALTLEKILNKSDKLETKEEKLIYLKKVINDCQRIIEIAEKIEGKYLDLNYLLKSEQNIDEYLIMFLEGLCEPLAKLPNEDLSIDKASKHGKVPWVVRQPRARYTFSLTDGDKVCDIQIAFGGVKSFKERIKDKIEIIEGGENNSGGTFKQKDERMKIKSRFSDVVRIFESMKESGIVSNKTTVKQFGELFFSNMADILIFERKYNSTKNRIEKENSTTNSEELLNFTLYLIENGFKEKDEALEKIIKHVERLQKT